MVGTEFFDVTIATVLFTSASYVEVDEAPIEDYGQDVLKLYAGERSHCSLLMIKDTQPPSTSYRLRILLFPSSTFQAEPPDLNESEDGGLCEKPMQVRIILY